MLLDLVYPSGNASVARLRCAVVCQNNAIGPLVVSLRNSAKPFLTSGVPDGKFDYLGVNQDFFAFEVETDSRLVRVLHGFFTFNKFSN